MVVSLGSAKRSWCFIAARLCTVDRRKSVRSLNLRPHPGDETAAQDLQRFVTRPAAAERLSGHCGSTLRRYLAETGARRRSVVEVLETL